MEFVVAATRREKSFTALCLFEKRTSGQPTPKWVRFTRTVVHVSAKHPWSQVPQASRFSRRGRPCLLAHGSPKPGANRSVPCPVRLSKLDLPLRLALRRRIVGCRPHQLILRRLELQQRASDTRRQSGELHFAVRIGAGLEIELVKSAKAIRDVNFDGRRPGGLAVGSGDREFNRARPRPAIDRRHRLRSCRGWRWRRLRVRLLR